MCAKPRAAPPPSARPRRGGLGGAGGAGVGGASNGRVAGGTDWHPDSAAARKATKAVRLEWSTPNGEGAL
jgi:hypothetical protein